MTPKQLEQLILANHRTLELFAAQWTMAPEDCVQEAFLKLFRLDRPVENPKAWLFRAVRNLAIDSGRSEASRRNREYVAGQARCLFTSKPEDLLSSEEIQTALERLSGDYREVIVARIWGRLTLEEIAEAFGMAPSTVHRRYELGIQKLKQYFKVPCHKNKTQ